MIVLFIIFLIDSAKLDTSYLICTFLLRVAITASGYKK